MILTIFEAVYGLRIDFAKISIFPVNNVANIHSLAGIPVRYWLSSHKVFGTSFGGETQVSDHLE